MTLDIMMPFYGDPAQFRDAVQSVLAQSSDDWRLVIIDDMYPDTAPGAWAAAIDDSRVRYIRNSQNLGVSGNFRRSLELMESEFGIIMGCDDRLLPDFVASFERLASQFPDASVIQPGVRVIDDDGVVVRPLADRVKGIYRPRVSGARALSGEALALSLARGNWAYFPSLIWRAETARSIGFRADLEVALDLELLFRIVEGGGTIVLDDRVVFEYRRHLGSVSAFTATDGSRFVEERDVLWAAASRFSARGWPRAARAAHRYLSSRLNALSILPRAASTATSADRRVLTNHILGRIQR